MAGDAPPVAPWVGELAQAVAVELVLHRTGDRRAGSHGLGEHRIGILDVDVHGHRRTADRLRRQEPVVGEHIARAKGMSQVARDTGISREGLYKALSGEGNPEFATVLKVMKALGLKLHATV